MFEDVMGRRQGQVFDDPDTVRNCELWLERVLAYYGGDGGVDVEIIDGQLGLCAKTAEHLYTDFTPLGIKYQPGARPFLEGVLSEAAGPGLGERERMLAIMRRCRDNQDRGLARPDLFTGGTEEELLKRGAIMCNEISRVFACLCQIAGLPARVHCSHISGHMMAEVYVDGKWGWVDAMKGLAPVLEDGRPASARELLKDPRLFERQPNSFWDDFRSPAPAFGSDPRDEREMAYQMARNRDCYFHPKEAMALGNYFVWEHGKYTYPWRIEGVDPQRERRARHEAMVLRRKMGWPDHYFNPLLFDEELKMR